MERQDFNSYGARRGNHEVMMRGTFANVRLRNLLAPGTEGGVTLHLPDGEQMTIYDASHALRRRGRAAGRARRQGVRLGVVAGLGGQGDVAARVSGRSSPRATSGSTGPTWSAWGSCPCSSPTVRARPSLGLTGHEVFDISGVESLNDGEVPKEVAVRAVDGDRVVEFAARLRIDTPMEAEYYRHGGILPYVLRQMAG